MAVQIGAKPDSGYDDPLGMLQDCHRRIEHFLHLLHQIGTSTSCTALTPEAIKAVEAALQYFRTSGPKHNADEEESVFPRLRTGIAADKLEQIDRLERDHDRAALLHDSVDLLFSSWIANHELRAKDQQLLRDNLEQLQSIYTGHIKLEETIIFPLAARQLSPDAIEAIGQEFRQRRK
jgi:hemerythrin-like domain-containing protein